MLITMRVMNERATKAPKNEDYRFITLVTSMPKKKMQTFRVAVIYYFNKPSVYKSAGFKLYLGFI
jgi:hypothetical protein